MNLEDGKTLFLLGAILIGAAAAVLVIGLACCAAAKKRLTKRLEAEYGKKRH